MKKPNFFIAGAPKCGTTSMAAWLAEHPQVFMSELKEPHHFDTDQPAGFKDRRDYEALFLKAQDSHIRVGEASVRYLHSRVAISGAIAYADSPKFIAMVRNPVEMAPALHEQYFFSLVEDIKFFDEAWRLQESRSAGNSIPVGCVDPNLLQYGAYCKLGVQIERAVNIIPQGDLLVLFLEDVAREPEKIYGEVLAFLGLEPFMPSFNKQNSAKEPRYWAVARAARIAVALKKRVGLAGKSFGIATKIGKWNRIERPRSPLSTTLKAELVEYFRDDITLLSKLTGRNLDHWLSMEPSI